MRRGLVKEGRRGVAKCGRGGSKSRWVANWQLDRYVHVVVYILFITYTTVMIKSILEEILYNA